MKKIFPLLILSLILLIPTEMTYGAKNSECQILENLFVGNIEHTNEVCKLEIPRKNLNVTLQGLKVSSEMIELSFGANFEKLENTTAVTGEFALLPNEVNPVIDALRKGNIEISALHNHWFGKPEVLYLHFQGTGELESLAKTVKSAIDVATEQTT